MKRVVGFGANVLDTLISLDAFPTEDKKVKAEKITLSGGGPVGNALVVMSKLGISAEVIGAFANDTAGEYLLSDFKRFGVGIENTALVPATSFSSYIILSENSGSRTCLYNRGTIQDDESLLKLSAIDNADVLHLDGNYIKSAIACAKYARSVGVRVSLDAGGLYEGIEELLPLVNILIPSCEFALGITGRETIPEAMAELYNRYSPEVLVVTDGERGGYYYDCGEIAHYDSFKIRPVDTNGAGDTFHGAFISAYLLGMDIGGACEFASACSAYKCLNIGAREYELNVETVKGFIEEAKEK